MYNKKIYLLSPQVNNYMNDSKQSQLLDQEELIQSKQDKNNANPISTFTTWLKIHQTIKTGLGVHSKSRSNISQQEEIPGSLTISQRSKNTINFHSFKKFNSHEFSFQKIYFANQTNFSVAKNIDIYEELVINNKDFCLLAIGGINSGIESLCQNDNKEGLFVLTLCSLYDQIESICQRKMEKLNESEFISNLKLTLKFIVISNQKLFDLNSPKNVVVLKDNKTRYIISGCQVFQPSSVYDISEKMQQMAKNRRLIYPESIFIVQGQLSYDRPSILGEMCSFTRYFSLIEWQKSLGKSQTNHKNSNNNMSLLNLNMCLYQLYKYSVSSEPDTNQSKAKKLSSIFRNSCITKILKNYIMNCGKLIVFGCVAYDQDEQEMYQTLMICKNAAKIKVNGQEEVTASLVMQKNSKMVQMQNVKGYSTQPLSTQKVQKKADKIDLLKVKEQLKKILKEKEMSQEKEKEKEVIQLIKIEGKKKRQLRNIRYQKEEIRLKQQIKEVYHSRTHSQQQANLPTISNINAQHSRNNSYLQKYVKNIDSQQEALKKEMEEIRNKLVRNMRDNSNYTLNHSYLKQQIHRQQNEIMDYMAHKQKMIHYLKNQVRELKKQRVNKNQVSVNPLHMSKRSRRTIEREYIQPKEANFQDKKVELNKFQEEFDDQASRNIRFMTQQPEQPKKNLLKISNRKSYLFEKRRQQLKQKIRKDKQQMNNYYEQAAKKFQQYSRIKK